MIIKTVTQTYFFGDKAGLVVTYKDTQSTKVKISILIIQYHLENQILQNFLAKDYIIPRLELKLVI